MAENFNLEQMEKETEEMLRVKYLTDENAVFSRTDGGFVSLTTEGETYSRISVVRMFPFTDKNEYISVRTVDEKSKEIGIIRDITKMTKETQKMLTEQLNMRYFTPIITKIIKIKDEYGYSYWDVLTDHGAIRFTMQMGSNAITHLSDTRILIVDIDENRFEIPDINQLSFTERKKLDLFL